MTDNLILHVEDPIKFAPPKFTRISEFSKVTRYKSIHNKNKFHFC